jgi:HAD superfamily hydrolase (TIGR01509 family)
MSIAAMLFDCDGTLVDTESLWAVAERAATEAVGGHWTTELKRAIIGRSLPEAAAVIAGNAGRGPAEVAGIAESLQARFTRVLADATIAPLPGALDLLGALAERGIIAAVVSNGARPDVELSLAGAGLSAYIAHVQCAESAMRPKPEPDLYLAACRALGVSAAHAVAIEDSDAGVRAARAAGLFTLAVPSVLGAAVEADLRVGGLWPLDLDELGRLVAARAA